MSMQQGPHETPDEYLSRLEARIDELQKEAILRKTAILKAQNDERVIAQLETSRDFHRNASSTRFALLQASKKKIEQALLYIEMTQGSRFITDHQLEMVVEILKGKVCQHPSSTPSSPEASSSTPNTSGEKP